MNIGILNELKNENRVAMLPESIAKLCELKVNVLIEHGAGDSAFANNADYENAGAKVDNRITVIQNSQIIIKINPPQPEDLENFKEGQVLIAVLNPFFNKSLIKTLVEKNITSFSLDTIPRITRAQTMDILSSMAMISGYKAVIDAANSIPRFFPMFMTVTGTIKPVKVLILGAGVAGLQAIATAKRLGAVVEIFDVRSAVKEEVMSLGGKFIEVEGSVEDDAAGGYAVEQTEEYKQKQEQLIHSHAIKSDVIICTAQIPGKSAPLLVKTETVEAMNPGSIIIDLAASTGGNCQLTKNNKTDVHNNIKIIGK